MEPKIKISDYTYNLPEERIAKYPLEKRDNSKLLLYDKGVVTEDIFYNIASYLPENSLMVFNNTKVVPARLYFRKETGALIEIFCLEPHDPSDYATAFASKGSCIWNVVIGNAKRWKNGTVQFLSDSEAESLNFRAELIEKEGIHGSLVRFLWDGEMTFSEVLDICGKMPIPPYLKRETESIDIDRYQTLYAKIKGSVAAPTAGLHFTDEVLEAIDRRNIKRRNICLHVGAGTFIPVKSEYISDHIMHTEPFMVELSLLKELYDVAGRGRIIAVGTTSTRSLESIYFLGVHCIENGIPQAVTQWEPYNLNKKYTLKESLEALIGYMERENVEKFMARTGIIILPGYDFKVIDTLITNFHQPQSTLLLLIAAFTGGNEWKKIYDYALANDFRFLSYGDSSLLFREP